MHVMHTMMTMAPEELSFGVLKSLHTLSHLTSRQPENDSYNILTILSKGIVICLR
jgi:hypothetical protein